MELESYFNFVNDTAIRLKGTRIGIETVIADYLAGASPEETVLHFPTLSLEQVHATITYFLANRVSVDTYVRRVEAEQMQGWEAQQGSPSEFVRSLRERLTKQKSNLHNEAKVSAG